jgi:hypothetical protein
MARGSNGTTAQEPPPVEQPGGAPQSRSARPQQQQPARRSEAALPTRSVPRRARRPAKQDGIVKGVATGKAAGTSRAEGVGDVVLPAIDTKGLRKRMRQMWDELGTGMLGLSPTEFKGRWNVVFEQNDRHFRGRGLKPTAERAIAFARFDAEVAAGRDPGARNFKRQLSKDLKTHPSQRTIDRWLKIWQNEPGQN